MIWYIVKLIVSAGIIVLISELSKKLPLLASLVASLPLVSVLGMIWMYGKSGDRKDCGSFSWNFLVCSTITAQFLVMLDVEERNFFSCIPWGRDCSDWSSLLYDDQSTGQFGMNL